MPQVRTRFSPSPTGKLHIGGLRTALYNFLYARGNQGQFLLRIEDTDQTRLAPGAVANITASLRWADLTYDNEPIIQSRRLNLYHEIAQRLLDTGHAYCCFCTPQRLEEIRHRQTAQKTAIRYDGHCRNLAATEVSRKLTARTPHVIRMKLPPTGTITFTDLVRGPLNFSLDTLDDQIIIKSDGFPTYHLAAVVDDHEMGITHVIRGEEWLPSTPKHLILFQSLGWTPPAYAHLPLLLSADRSKLSKRTGDVAVDDYRAAGYLPEAVLNFVLLLGWNPGTEQEIFDRDNMIAAFRLERVNKSGAVFNPGKLNWINGWYIRHLPVDELLERALPFLQTAGLAEPAADRAYLRQVVAVEQQRIKRLGELPALVEYFFRPPSLTAKLIPWKTQTPESAGMVLGQLKDFLAEVPPEDFTASGLTARIRAWIAIQHLSNGEVLWPLRVALTGRESSPSPFEVAAVLGKSATLERLAAAIACVGQRRGAAL